MAKLYRQDEVEAIIRGLVRGDSNRRIAQEIGRTNGAILMWRNAHSRFLANKDMRSYVNYKIYLDEYYKKHDKTGWVEKKPQKIENSGSNASQTNLDRLFDAFIQFQDTLVDVIEAEATRRAEEKTEEMKEKYEKEKKRLETLLEEAKQGNRIGTLRKAFGLGN